MGAALLAAACSGTAPVHDAAADGPNDSGYSTGSDLPPVVRLRYQTQSPRDDGDYPYSATDPAAVAPAPEAPVYLSAEGSLDPEGRPVSFFWNAQGPQGEYLSISPDPTAVRASFVPLRIGPHTVTLEVIETGGLHQIAQSTLTLEVAPAPCAPDGVSRPCGDELPVPGGSFLAGTEADAGSDNEHPAHSVTVAPFLMDRYEVTVGRFRRYLTAYDPAMPTDGAGAHPLIANSGWHAAWAMALPSSRDEFSFAVAECGGTWTDLPGSAEALPMTCVTWFEAFAFCAAEGKRLPTEAEWEYAAAGGGEQRPYPWGSAPPSAEYAVYGCLFDGQPGCSMADLPGVGSRPRGAGRWGHLDLAGSVWEWLLDVYQPYSSAPCDNCAPVSDDIMAGRVFRGGDFRQDEVSYLRTAARLGFTGGFPDQARGFRCARSDATAARAPAATP